MIFSNYLNYLKTLPPLWQNLKNNLEKAIRKKLEIGESQPINYSTWKAGIKSNSKKKGKSSNSRTHLGKLKLRLAKAEQEGKGRKIIK